MRPPPDGLARWEIRRADSVLVEQRRRGAPDAEVGGRIEARAPSADDVPLRALSSFLLDGRAIFWLDARAFTPLVDERFSSDLLVVDATSLGPGERCAVGSLTPRARALPPATIVEALVRADVVRTWAHLGSTVCLQRIVVGDNGGWRADVCGEHSFVTRRRHTASFAFVVVADADGAVAVVGRER
jgi:hypothetical protein